MPSVCVPGFSASQRPPSLAGQLPLGTCPACARLPICPGHTRPAGQLEEACLRRRLIEVRLAKL